MTCKDCVCYDCAQRANCNMNGCDGGGCVDHDYFKSDCDDYEVDPYSGEEDWEDEDD